MGARTVAFIGGGVLALLLGTALAGVGFYVSLQTSCGSSYVVAVQPADEVADTPEATVKYATLTDHQQRAFDAGRTGSDSSFGPRESLDRLDGAVVVYEGDRYVTRVRADDCANPGKWLVYGGGTLALVGFFAALLGVVRYVYG